MNEQELIKEYSIKKSSIIKRLGEFKQVKESDLFYEFCFCLLTPQTSARRADKAIQILKQKDFRNKNFHPSKDLHRIVRFHNHKGEYLIELKNKYNNLIKELNNIKDNKEKREFLVKNVKGMGMKEAAHFLRNTGHENLAILDRHILKNLNKLGAIKEIPKSISKKQYLELENKFIKFSNKIKIPIDHLDLLFWSQETGEIFK